jgi:hypothetical protein
LTLILLCSSHLPSSVAVPVKCGHLPKIHHTI